MRRGLRTGKALADIRVVKLDGLQSGKYCLRAGGVLRRLVQLGVGLCYVPSAAGIRVAHVAGNHLLRRGIVTCHVVPHQVKGLVIADSELRQLLRVEGLPVVAEGWLDEFGENLDVGGVLGKSGTCGCQGSIEHGIRELGQCCPVPIRHCERGITAQIPDGFLEVTQIPTVPDVEPPIAVGAVHQVYEGVSEPVVGIGGGKVQHRLHTFCIACERPFAARTHHVVTCILRFPLRLGQGPRKGRRPKCGNSRANEAAPSKSNIRLFHSSPFPGSCESIIWLFHRRNTDNGMSETGTIWIILTPFGRYFHRFYWASCGWRSLPFPGQPSPVRPRFRARFDQCLRRELF